MGTLERIGQLSARETWNVPVGTLGRSWADLLDQIASSVPVGTL